VKFLLDTDTCVLFLKRASPALTARICRHATSALGISAISLAELEFGVAHSEHRARNAVRLKALRGELQSVPFDAQAAAIYGPLRSRLAHRGALIGPLDLLIAATALSRGVTLVTHNTREFRRVTGLRVEDWARDS
jgi:tRNA(fMet)-specific endonuclease VapC